MIRVEIRENKKNKLRKPQNVKSLWAIYHKNDKKNRTFLEYFSCKSLSKDRNFLYFRICYWVSWNGNDRTFLPKIWSMKKFKIYLNVSFHNSKIGKRNRWIFNWKRCIFYTSAICEAGRQAKVYSLQLPSVWINLRVVPMCVCYSLIVVAVCASINFYCLWFPLEQLKCRLYVFLTAAAMGEIACFHL